MHHKTQLSNNNINHIPNKLLLQHLKKKKYTWILSLNAKTTPTFKYQKIKFTFFFKFFFFELPIISFYFMINTIWPNDKERKIINFHYKINSYILLPLRLYKPIIYDKIEGISYRFLKKNEIKLVLY